MAKGGFRGGMPMGGMNQMQMMKQAQKMQQDLLKMQQEMEEKQYEATAGGGVITASRQRQARARARDDRPGGGRPRRCGNAAGYGRRGGQRGDAQGGGRLRTEHEQAHGRSQSGRSVRMRTFPAALERLSEQFARLPGIGSKTAQRLAFQVLSMPQEQAQEFADAILDAKRSIHTCPVCQNLTDERCAPSARTRRATIRPSAWWQSRGT